MTKKQAYKIIEEHYGDYAGRGMIFELCTYLDFELNPAWCKYWDKINNKNHSRISSAFAEYEDKNILSSLTRMMLLHDFIEDTYK